MKALAIRKKNDFSRILTVLTHHLTEVKAKCKLNVYIFMILLAV